jgi:PAS domain S-box-containing protein
MATTLRVLNVEDSEPDLALLTRHLSLAGYDVVSERVDTADAMRTALEAGEWDVILCDYAMPQFDALGALKILKEKGLDTPFIIISGTVGEETAVEAMRAGAHDYLMKDNLVRLAPTIERELLEAENRRARRQAEASLSKSEGQHRRLLDTAYEGVWVFDAELQTTYVNQRLTEMLRVRPEEMIGHSALDFLDPESRADVGRRWRRRAQDIREQYDLRIERRDGSDLWVIVSATSIRGERGEFLGALSMLTDITERKQAEAERGLLIAEIESQRQRLKSIVASVPGVVWEAWGQPDAATQQINFVSDYVETMLGYTQEEWLATPNFWLTIVHPDDQELAGRQAAASFADRRHSTVEFRWISKDGRAVWVESNYVVVTDDEGRSVGLRGVTTDISERKRAQEALRESEEQLRQSQRMEAVGQLAGGVAHDFNNLLTVITGYSELALNSLNAEDPLRSNIEDIKKAGDQATSLTRQLLAFSRRQVLQPKILSLNFVISELEKMLRRLVGEHIDLQTELKLDLDHVSADPGQIEQTIMNLVVNARDAMPQGGTLTIETANVYLDEEFASQHVGVRPGSYAMLAVSDTGVGIEEETLKRIFEPFFTTKELGKGTGLGLSMVHGIVKQSGGHIWVHSELGRGTTFEIHLPTVDAGAPEFKRKAHSQEPVHGTETILLAEDEGAVRKLTRQVLEMYGYRVLEAANGRTALLLCEQNQGPIHLLLTDVIMPQMNGRELADRIAKLRPEMKVMYMSGYASTSIIPQEVLEEGTRFIEKPFATQELGRKIRELLDQG